MDLITIEPDGFYCKADKPLIPAIATILQYERTVVIRKQWGRDVKTKPAYFIDKRNGRFLKGLLNRVIKGLKKDNISFKIDNRSIRDMIPGEFQSPKLEGLELRKDQLHLIQRAQEYKQGVIVSPTGSGKTITAIGLISCWPKATSLILTHRLDILEQFVSRIKKHLPSYTVSVIGGKNPNTLSNSNIVCGTIQSVSKIFKDDIADMFDITICDECHHVNDKKSQYGQLMLKNLAPMRIGLTATLPTDRSKKLAMEGLLGPVIGRLSLHVGQQMGIVAKPYIKLVQIPFDGMIADNKSYRDIYDKGIVNNNYRNRQIIQLTKNRADQNKTSLIIIKNIKHGTNLIDIAKKCKLHAKFIYSGTQDFIRNKVKKQLDDKKTKVVICTDVWKEGIDIPTLDCVVIACSGKSELQTIQAVGRGIRTAEGKTKVEIIDFLDPYKYLAQHAVRRIAVYVQNRWL